MRQIELPNTYWQVYDALIIVLEKLEVKVVHDTNEEGIIIGKTKTSIWSWGEKIEIQLEELNDGGVELTVESTSIAQLIGWGKNAENEETIVNNILDELE